MKIHKTIHTLQHKTTTEFETCICDSKVCLQKIDSDVGDGYWLRFVEKDLDGKEYELNLHACKGMLQAIATLVFSEFEKDSFGGSKYLPKKSTNPEDFNIV